MGIHFRVTVPVVPCAAQGPAPMRRPILICCPRRLVAVHAAVCYNLTLTPALLWPLRPLQSHDTEEESQRCNETNCRDGQGENAPGYKQASGRQWKDRLRWRACASGRLERAASSCGPPPDHL